MDNMEKIRQMAEELNKVVSETFGSFTIASVTVYGDGHMYIDASLFDEDENVAPEFKMRRSLFHQWRSSMEWEKEDSKDINDYHKERGILLEV